MYYFRKTVFTPNRISEYVSSKTIIYKLRKTILTKNLANHSNKVLYNGKWKSKKKAKVIIHLVCCMYIENN